MCSDLQAAVAAAVSDKIAQLRAQDVLSGARGVTYDTYPFASSGCVSIVRRVPAPDGFFDLREAAFVDAKGVCSARCAA